MNASRDGDDELGERGQLVLRAEVREHVLERRDDEAEQDAEHADEDDDDDGRIDHRAAHLALQLHVLLDVDREPVQDRVEDAADLAGLDEVHVEVVEDLRVPAERVAEGGALLDARLHVLEDVREELVVGLPLEDLEALHDGQAGVDHRREEAREGDEVLAADARADAEARTPCPSS